MNIQISDDIIKRFRKKAEEEGDGKVTKDELIEMFESFLEDYYS